MTICEHPYLFALALMLATFAAGVMAGRAVYSRTVKRLSDRLSDALIMLHGAREHQTKGFWI